MRYHIVPLTVIGTALACLAAAMPMQEPASRHDQAETIRRMLIELHEDGEFTGSVVVAQAGIVIYRDAIDSTPDDARKLLTSPSNIGSVAKGFTAMAVMMLAEQGRLSYDDLIARHVTELAGATPGITIRHLLTHTSGIPDVGDLGIDRPRLRETDVANAIRTHHGRFARPGLKYRYSNTGYILLAMAVENVSGRTFDAFLQSAMFDPLGMNDTRPERGPRTAEEAKGHGELVSTADDLLKWDQALAGEKLVSAKRIEIADAIVNILHGRPFVPPKLSLARRLLGVIDAQGVDAALSHYEQLRRTPATRYDVSEAELNSLGYTLLERRRNVDAIRVFELNARQFPSSSNAFDGLGEALSRSGRRAEAAQAYSRALELDPSNVNARAKLQEVKSRTWQLTAAAAVFVVGVSSAWFLRSRLKRAVASGPSRE